MTPFLQLEDFLLSAPLPACLAGAMCLGLKHLGSLLVGAMRRSSPQPIELAAGFILATGLIAVLSNMIAAFGLAYIWPLRIIAFALAGCGVVELFRLRDGYLSYVFFHLQTLFRKQSLAGKIGILLVCVIGICLCLASLAPPTDADSLDYHLGVPLDILRHHRAYPRPDWLDARLVGLGEALNMLGLAGGTDVFGASLQFSGLLLTTIAVMSMARTDSDRLLAAMVVIGCPLLLFLIPNQKPQMLPTASTTIALIMIAQRFKSIDPVTICLALGNVFFAMSCKYSFLLSGSIVIGTLLVAAYQNRQVGIAICFGLAGFLIFLFPLYLQKFLFYGDPLTPLLERFFEKNVAVIEYANMLQDYKDPGAYALSLIFPGAVGSASTALGIGAFLIFGIPGVSGSGWLLITCGLLLAILTGLMGQVAARFIFEPYLWISAAVVGYNTWKIKRVFFKLMVGQMLGVAVLAAFAATILFPGVLSDSLRQRVMQKYAAGYSEAKWLDKSLPQNAVVLTDLRSMALMPRQFLASQSINFSLLVKDEGAIRSLPQLLKDHGVDTWVTDFPCTNPFLRNLFPTALGEPHTFRKAVRNPWNTGSYRIIAYRNIRSHH